LSKLPIVTFQTWNKLLLRLGFEVVRQKGSHVFYRHPNGKTTTVPHHKGKDLPRSLTRKILNDIDLSPEKFIEELQNL
jgi:predicted RNA binding protein YcfA (HicA-like mRNA interferase family)